MTGYLCHHGILGMKWGIRRYQNPDGSLTEAGKLRYKVDANGKLKKLNPAERAQAQEKHDVSRFVSGRKMDVGSERAARRAIARNESGFEDEYEHTPEGSKTLKRMRETADAVDEAYRTWDYSVGNPKFTQSERDQFAKEMSDASNAYNAAVTQHAVNMGQFVVSKMIEQYGDTGANRYYMTDRYDTSLAEAYVTSYEDMHFLLGQWD